MWKYFNQSEIDKKNPLQWRNNGRDGVSIHQPCDCLFNRLFGRRSKKTSKIRVTGLCVGNAPVTGEFPAQKASNAENVSIWWRHHEQQMHLYYFLVIRKHPTCTRFTLDECCCIWINDSDQLCLSLGGILWVIFVKWFVLCRIILIMESLGLIHCNVKISGHEI